MEKGKTRIHPEYRFVVFKDISTDYCFISKSDGESSQTIQWEDGNTYPLVQLDITKVKPNGNANKMSEEALIADAPKK